MKWKTASGKFKNIPMDKYLVDWNGKQDSLFSRDVLAFLKPFWKHDIVCAQVPVAGTRMSYDYVNVSKRVIVEADGQQHDNLMLGFFHKTSEDYKAQIKRDIEKDELAEKNGFKMVRVKPSDLPLNKEWFLKNYDINL